MFQNFHSVTQAVLLATILLGTTLCSAADLIEFLDGKTLEGTILQIRSDAKEFDFEAKIGEQTIQQTYPYSQVHAVTYKDRRFELTPKPRTTNGTSGSSDGELTRSKEQVLAMIEQAGETPPDWLESTPLNHPRSLELDWPLKAEGPWNESKNVGQYLWGRVSPNTGRWKSGIKLVHECLDRHQGDPALVRRDQEKLGELYFVLLQDYARAAYWLQQAKSRPDKSTGIYLAECYWRLGNKPMAMSVLRGRKLHFDAIKLFGDMGELNNALRVTRSYASTNFFNQAYINAGDALRGAGKTDEAIEYYNKVLTINKARNKDYLARFKARAAGAIEAIQLYDKADVSRVADGTYIDSSTAYNGKLEVNVVVANNRIESVKVTKHKEKQFYAALTDTTGQIVEKQSIQDIDGTSGATITSQAIIHATARALAQGARP